MAKGSSWSFPVQSSEKKAFFLNTLIVIFSFLILKKPGCGSGITDPDQQISATDPNSPEPDSLSGPLIML